MIVCVLVQLSLFFIYLFLVMQGELVRLFANDQNKIRCGNVFNRSRHGFVVVIAGNVFCFYNRCRDANRN